MHLRVARLFNFIRAQQYYAGFMFLDKEHRNSAIYEFITPEGKLYAVEPARIESMRLLCDG